MRKIYTYEKTFAIGDDDVASLTVDFISDGNIAYTSINIPGPQDPAIANSGTQRLGTGAKLKTQKTVCVSDIANPISQETDITVEYRIRLNGDDQRETILVSHSNPKTATDQPLIILIIEFTAR